MLRAIRVMVACVAVFVVTAGQVHAGVLYGATGGSTNSDLFIIDQSTGAVISTVGPIGFAVTGLSFNPVDGVLYGSTSAQSPSGTANSIITIDLTTGAGTLVGATNLGPLADISFDAGGTLYGWSEGIDELATVNLGTGAATEVGSGAFAQFTRGSGLDFDGSGTLFAAGRIEGFLDGALHLINPATGTSSGTFDVSPDPEAPVNALAFDSATGLMYGSSSGRLFTINMTTGAITDVGFVVTGLDALAFHETAAVPEPASIALVGIAAVGMGLGAFRRRRAIKSTAV